MGWPSRLKLAGSATPRTSESSVFTDLDSRSSSTRSLPKILIEFSPFTPETASSILSWMYCEKLKSTPTNSRLSRSLICLTICSLVNPAGHSVGRLQRDKELGEERAVGIGAFIAASLLGKHGLDRRIARDHGADLGHRFHPGLQRDGRRHHGPDPQIALFQLGQEFGAEPQARD